MSASRLALLALAASSALATAPAISAPFLAPHRAVYDLVLDRASDRSGITGLSGRMVYEFNGSACEGYTVTFRFVTRIDTGDSTRVTDQQTTTFEDGDGKTFSFVTKSFVDQNLDREVKGTATRESSGLTVDIEKPKQEVVDLGPTQFPTQHLIELLDKAEKRRELLRDEPVRRIRGRRQGDDHDRGYRQAGKRREERSRTAGTRKPAEGCLLARRHRLFRRNAGGRARNCPNTASVSRCTRTG